jgi:prevent-host-death family protein
LIEAAEGGHTTIITRRGRPVAALVPVDAYRLSHRQESLLPLEGSGRSQWGKNSTRALGKLRDEWDR